jgi:hypothetical protein
LDDQLVEALEARCGSGGSHFGGAEPSSCRVDGLGKPADDEIEILVLSRLPSDRRIDTPPHIHPHDNTRRREGSRICST